MNQENRRVIKRHAISNINLGLTKPGALFFKKPPANIYQLIDLSCEGFKAICAMYMEPSERYNFSFDLPVYGSVMGTAEVIWVKRSIKDINLSTAGFKFIKLKGKGANVLSEVTSSQNLVDKLCRIQ